MTSPPPMPTVESLLAHADWVRKLATALAGRSAADDIVQDTWLATIQSPPSSGANVRGWLTKVVQNLARQVRRTEDRRRARESRLPRDGELPSSAELAERAEVHRRIVEAVLALPDPGRTVVLLHYFEGLSLRDVAIRQRVPLETVRTRHKRAVERLRRSFGAQGRRAALLATPIAGAFTNGVLMSKTKVLAAVLVTCVLGVGYGTWANLTADGPPAPSAGNGVVAAASAGVEQEQRAAAAPDASDREQLPPAAPVDAGPADAEDRLDPVVLHGRLVGLDAELPWSRSIAIGRGGDDHPQARCELDVDGRFAIDVAPWLRGTSGVEVIADDPLYLRVRRTLSARLAKRSSAERPVELQVSPACVLVGKVVTAAGHPVGRAPMSVHLIRDGQPVGQPVDITNADESGSYRMRVPGGTVALVVAFPAADLAVPVLASIEHVGHLFRRKGLDGWLPAATRVVTSFGKEVAVPDTVLRPGQIVKGHVRHADGTPVPDAKVRAYVDDNPVMLYAPEADVRWWPDDSLWFDERHAQADENGAFQLDNLPTRACQVAVDYWLDDTICHSRSLERTVQAPSYEEAFELPGGILDVSVVHQGKALADAWVGVEHEGLLLKRGISKGKVRLLLHPDRKYRVTAGGSGHVEQAIEVTAPLGRTARVFELERAPERIVTLQLTGVPGVEVARFVWHRLDAKGVDAIRKELHDGGGTFAFDDIPPGRYRVEVRRPRMPGHRLHCVFADTSVEVSVPYSGKVQKQVPLVRGGRLRIRATTPDGVYLDGTSTLTGPDGERISLRYQIGGSGGYVTTKPDRVTARGVNEADRLFAPGVYRLRIEFDQCDPFDSSVSIEAGEIADVEVLRQLR